MLKNWYIENFRNEITKILQSTLEKQNKIVMFTLLREYYLSKGDLFKADKLRKAAEHVKKFGRLDIKKFLP